MYIPSYIQRKISRWNRCSRYLNSWYWNNRMRFLECLKSAGKVLHGNSYLWSMMKKSSVSLVQRSTYSQILCYVLERWIRTQHQILFVKKSWVGSKIHHNTELWTQSTENQWNSSGIFSQDPLHWSLSVKSRSSWAKWADQNNSKDELSLCRWTMTSYGDLKTMKRNVLQIAHLCLYSQKDSSRTLVIPRTWIRNKVVFYWQRKNTRRMGQSRSIDDDQIWRKRTSPLSRGTLRSKDGGKLSVHFSTDGDTIETVFRTIISVNQLSVSTEQSQTCVKNTVAVKQEQGDLLWQDNLTHCLCQQTYW